MINKVDGKDISIRKRTANVRESEQDSELWRQDSVMAW